MDFDPVLLARLQFAFAVAFHIIFPSFTIGLSAYIATWYCGPGTGRDRYHAVERFWTKIFAVSFGMGVVSGSCCPISSAPTGAASRSSPATSSGRCSATRC